LSFSAREIFAMDAESAALATGAATALVGAMTTDAWQSVKESVVALWRRAHPDRAETIRDELEESRTTAATAAAGSESAGQATLWLICEWQSRLARLLEQHPALADELGSLLAWGKAQRGGDTFEVHIEATAKDRSKVNIAGRDMHINEHEF
jgi:hypothetical protein